MTENLTAYEQETIINFNKAEDMANIFTYDKRWQRHLERNLGLKPIMDNGYGGKEYEIPKERIPLPREKKHISAETRARLLKQLIKSRRTKG